MPKGTLTGHAIVAHLDTEQALFGNIRIACPVCGEFTLLIPGHHMKTLRDLLIEWCDTFPELTGTSPIRLGTTAFSGSAPSDPSTN